MKRRKLDLAVAVLFVVFGVSGCWFAGGSGESDSSSQAPVGAAHLRAAPGFELKDASGAAHSLASLKGNAVIVHFWASWCPPCLAETPQLLQMMSDFKGAKLKLVMVSMDEKWEDALKILPVKGVPENVVSVLDTTQKLADTYGTFQFPESYLLDPELKVLTKLVGPQNWDNPKLREAIRVRVPK